MANGSESSPSNFTRRRAASIGLAAAVGLAYFLAALLSYGLSLTSEGLAVFWPASGVSTNASADNIVFSLMFDVMRLPWVTRGVTLGRAPVSV